MELSRSLLRRRGAAVLAVGVLALLASGCSEGVVGRTPAATVNDGEISQADVQRLGEANAAFYRQTVDEGQDTTGEAALLLDDLTGTGAGTLGMQGADDALTSLIVTEVTRQELVRRDALPESEAFDASRADLEAQLGEERLAELDPDIVDFSVESRTLVQALQEELAAEADQDLEPVDPVEREQQLRELYEIVAPERPLCLNIILTGTEDEAAAARAQVEGGEDFGAVAQAVSVEPTTAADGGFAGCADYESATAAFGQSFEGLAQGDLVGPAPFGAETGAPPQFAVIQVAGTDGPTYEQLLPQLEAQIPAEAQPTDPASIDVTTVQAELLAEADIDVDPRFGTWDDELFFVQPPEAPPVPGDDTAPVPTLVAPVTPEN